MAQKLRDYNETGNDSDLNKFVINSLIPASVPDMDSNDAKDVISKVKDNIGNNNDEVPSESNPETTGDENIPTENDIEQDQGINKIPEECDNKPNVDDFISRILTKKHIKPTNKTKLLSKPNFK